MNMDLLNEQKMKQKPVRRNPDELLSYPFEVSKQHELKI